MPGLPSHCWSLYHPLFLSIACLGIPKAQHSFSPSNYSLLQYCISIFSFIQMSPPLSSVQTLLQSWANSNPCVCLQVYSSSDARLVQHHSPFQKTSLCHDCYRVGPGLRCVLSPAVWLQHHRSGQQRSYFVFLSGCFLVTICSPRSRIQSADALCPSEIQNQNLAFLPFRVAVGE